MPASAIKLVGRLQKPAVALAVELHRRVVGGSRKLGARPRGRKIPIAGAGADAPLVGERVRDDRLELRSPPMPLFGSRTNVAAEPVVVEAPHAHERQQCRVHFEAPAVGELRARVEAHGRSAPGLGLGNHEHRGARGKLVGLVASWPMPKAFSRSKK